MSQEICRKPFIVWGYNVGRGATITPPSPSVGPAAQWNRSVSPYGETVREDRLVTRRDPRCDGWCARSSRVGRGSRINELPSHHVDLRGWSWSGLRYSAGG